MNINHKAQLIQRSSSLKTNLISKISKSYRDAVLNQDMANFESKMASAILSAVRTFEEKNKASNFTSKEELPLPLQLETKHGYNQNSNNPEIEELERLESRLQSDLYFKEQELRNLNRQASLSRDFTRNESIKGLVLNIIKKFKKLSEEKQLELVNNRGKLSNVVKKYVKDLFVFYDTEENAWGLTFKKNGNLLDTVSTGKDVVILAVNLSSKYVHLATSAIYSKAKIHHAICRKERDDLKSELAKVSTRLQVAYAKDGTHYGFRGGFGGGGTGGGGAYGKW